jgi:hypothetical protein
MYTRFPKKAGERADPNPYSRRRIRQRLVGDIESAGSEAQLEALGWEFTARLAARLKLWRPEEDVMTREFFKSPFRIQELHGGQSHLLDVFTEDLRQSGFAQITARRHIRAAEHLLYWANRKCIGLSAFDDHALDEFARHLRRCRCKGFGHTHRRDLQNGARLFIGNLRRAALLPIPSVQETVEDSHVLVLVRDWKRRHRGTCDATLYNYNQHC